MREERRTPSPGGVNEEHASTPGVCSSLAVLVRRGGMPCSCGAWSGQLLAARLNLNHACGVLAWGVVECMQ
jgi:hypothetical protein